MQPGARLRMDGPDAVHRLQVQVAVRGALDLAGDDEQVVDVRALPEASCACSDTQGHAALAAAKLTQGQLMLITDSRYGEGTVNRGAGHLGWTKGSFSPVWEAFRKLCAPDDPRAVWINSHLKLAEAMQRVSPKLAWKRSSGQEGHGEL